MNVSGTTISATGHKGGLGDGLYDKAGARPDLDLDFARTKSLKDRVSKEDLITFTRSTTASGSHTGATYVDEKGYINRAGSNLIKYSQDFSQSDWTKANSTFTSNNVVAPDGTLTAGTWSEDAIGYGIKYTDTSNNGHWLIDPSSTSTSSSVPLGGSFANVPFPSDGSWIRGRTYPFTVPTTNNQTLTLYILFKANARNIRQAIPIVDNKSYVYSAWIKKDPSTGKIYTWGVQLEPASNYPTDSHTFTGTHSLSYKFHSEYVKTTTQPNSAPRFTHDPVTLESKGLLIEQVATNLVTSSEDIMPIKSQGGWGNNRANKISNQITAPDGTLTADEIEYTGTGSNPLIFQAKPGNGVYTISAFFKKGNTDGAHIYADNNAFRCAIFDLENETTGPKHSTFSSSSIEDYGNGWFRCSATTVAIGGANFGYGPCEKEETSTNNIIPSTSDASVYVWGMQIEAGSVLTSYIPTPATSSVTRSPDLVKIDGDNFGTYRTNKVVETKPFLHSFGVKSSVTLQRHAAANPVTGEYDAVKVIGGAGTGGDAHIQVNLQGITNVGAPSRVLADGTRVVFSFYARTDPGQTFAVRPKMGRNNVAALYNNPTITITDTWQRHEFDDNGATISLTKALFGLQFTQANTTIYTYGWQIEERASTDSTPATSFIPSTDTFTNRQSNATFVDGNGIIRTAHKNLMPYSEKFGVGTPDNTYWINSHVQLDFDANHINPDGSTGTFYGNTYTDGNAEREIYDYFDAASANTDTLTFSLFCKKRDANSTTVKIQVYVSVGNATYGTDSLGVCSIFHPPDGTFIEPADGYSTSGGNAGRIITNQKAEDYGNGWWRMSFTVQLNGGSTQSPIFTNTSRFDIQNLHQCYIWGAQVVKGTEAGDYYKTTGTPSGPPRYSHDPETLTPTGLYLEPAATNLIQYSEDFSNSEWIKNSATLTPNATTAPDGTNTASKLEVVNETDGHRILDQGVSLGPNIYTYSVFIKPNTTNQVLIKVYKSGSTSTNILYKKYNFDTEVITGDRGSLIVEKYANGWYRLIGTTMEDSTTANSSVTIALLQDNVETFTGNGESIYIWGAQIELGNVATAYIKSTGQTDGATRSADIFTSTATEVLDRANGTKPAFYTKSGLSAFVRGTNQPNPPTYAFRFFEFTGGHSTSNADLSLTANSNGTKIGVFQHTDTTHAEPQGIGSGQTSPNTTLGLDNKMAARYQTDNTRLYVNGEEGSLVDSSYNNGIDARSSTRLCIGANGGSSGVGTSRILNGTIQRLTFWKTPFPDSKLDKLTS